jgi:hypothetical protein
LTSERSGLLQSGKCQTGNVLRGDRLHDPIPGAEGSLHLECSLMPLANCQKMLSQKIAARSENVGIPDQAKICSASQTLRCHGLGLCSSRAAQTGFSLFPYSG